MTNLSYSQIESNTILAMWKSPWSFCSPGA